MIGGAAIRARAARPRRRGIRRVALPVALALGVILLLRHFEQSTSN